jgi:hypothetical protein
MNDELKRLKKYIESSIVNERNHIFKYTSVFTRPQSSPAKAVYLEYDRATSNDRYHNYHAPSYTNGHPQSKEKNIPSLYEFLAGKLRYHFKKNRKSYVNDMIQANFITYNELGDVEDIALLDYDFTGETDHEIFNLWLLFEYLFEIEEQITRIVESKNLIGIQSHLDLIDDKFGFLMGCKNSYFQIKMNKDELYSWLLGEILLFKHQVQDKGLWRSLNKEPEKHFQWIFTAALGRVSELFDVCMLAESDVGRGYVDFIFSQGNDSKVCVELKLSSSSRVLEGYTKQLPQYLKSEQTDKGIYVVIDSGDSSSSFQKLLSFIEEGKKNGQSYPDIILVDASLKPSASKL